MMAQSIRILALACVLAATGARAHPDLVSEYATELEAEKKRSAQENEARGLIQATSFFGSPVHEEQTIRSVTLSNVLGRAFDINQAGDRAFLRGVIWNDDPEVDLWSRDDAKGPDTLGIVWAANFLKLKGKATANPPTFFRSGDPLLGRSHFGDLQFLHGMAEADNLKPADTQAKALLWLEFTYRVAQGKIAGSTPIARVPMPGIRALFARDPAILKGTVADLFRHRVVREFAAGSFLHLIQDSYAGGHVQRERRDRSSDGLAYFGRGAVLRFHSYAGQDADLHKADDRLPPTLRLNAPLNRLGDDPVLHGAILLRMMFGADGKGAVPWEQARKYLLDHVFVVSPAAQASGPGDCYRKDAAPPPACGATASRDAAGSPQKLALLIGIDDYRAVAKLKGAVNDALNMKKLLLQKFGFAEQDIMLLLDGQATRAAILDEMRKLTERVQNEDAIVLIHFSGHGSQQPDTDGDEDDGMDETILAVDSRLNGVRDISDDEINGWIRGLNARTRNVVLVMDSCHSGTGARLADVALRARYVPPDPALLRLREAEDRARTAVRTIRADARAVSPLRDPNAQDLHWVAISGSRANELSYEYTDGQGQPHGAMTFFLVRALNEAGPRTTYRDVHERIAQEVATAMRAQHPQIDGPAYEGLIFAAGSLAAAPFFTARAYGDGIALDAGRVHGVGKDATFKLYPPGTKTFDSGTHTGIAKVTQALAYSSVATLESGGFATIGVMRAIEHERSIEDFELRVHLAPALPAGPAAAARAIAG
ncbi:MAG: caspase family protein, partial [Burkholderiales bacterium]